MLHRLASLASGAADPESLQARSACEELQRFTPITALPVADPKVPGKLVQVSGIARHDEAYGNNVDALPIRRPAGTGAAVQRRISRILTPVACLLQEAATGTL
jgi:hypothetical protein